VVAGPLFWPESAVITESAPAATRKRLAPQRAAILAAVTERWGSPDRIPQSMKPKDRDAIINTILAKDGFKIPDSARDLNTRAKAIREALHGS
jgi:hypothetical protein